MTTETIKQATTETIPFIDVSEWTKDKKAFAEKLGRAFQKFGFVGLTNHGVAEAAIANHYDTAKAFFAQPDAAKRAYHIAGSGGARGYTPFGIEGAKDRNLGDLKEFWHFGRDLPADHKMKSVMADNVIVAEVPAFNKNGMALYAELEKLGDTILSALALFLGQKEDFFADKTDYGNSILRAIHYPPIEDQETPALRAGAHEDINLITLLVGSGEPGLEVQARDGSWIAIDTIPGTIVCNIGDMLQRWTNHVLPSTTHRVVNPTGPGRLVPRYSTPFFVHPNPDAMIMPLETCVSAENPSRYPRPISSHDYLTTRLYEIGLIKELPTHLKDEVAAAGTVTTAGEKAKVA